MAKRVDKAPIFEKSAIAKLVETKTDHVILVAAPKAVPSIRIFRRDV
ncbi:MAG: hypothetical protein V1495_06635 [Pseudomonadota bacterium]